MNAKEAKNIIHKEILVRVEKEYNEIIDRVKWLTSNVDFKDGIWIRDLHPRTIKKLKKDGYTINPWGKNHHINYGDMLFIANPNPWYKLIKNWFMRNFVNNYEW